MSDREGDVPRVTVVVTCFNQAHWIQDALDSVANQTEQPLRLIVTDDGSSDTSVEVIRRWLAERRPDSQLIASPENRGLPAMLNLAMPHFVGDYVVVLNGDDWMETDRLERQADFFAELPTDTGVVYSRLREVDESGVPRGAESPKPENTREGPILCDLIEGINLGMGTLMVRREVFDRVGSWDESLVADDLDLLLRIAAAGYEFRYLPMLALNYRVNAKSLTQSRSDALIESRFRAVQKHVGPDPEVTTVALERLAGLAVALHGVGYDRRVTRNYLWFVLRRRPTRRIVRAFVESVLGLRPGRLALRRTQ